MQRGKLIVIEGTDASGKNTQSELLFEKLKQKGIPCFRTSFPMYQTPTGKIVGGPLLGKQEINKSYFENPAELDPKVTALYYLADRVANIGKINELLESGINVILDRYVESNMGHQGGKIKNSEEREEFYKFLDNLEYVMFKLPRPVFTIFLYMPFEKGIELKSKMNVEKDEVEKNFNYLKNSEEAYLQLSDLYKWKKIDCIKDNELRTREDIAEEVFEIVKEKLNFNF